MDDSNPIKTQNATYGPNLGSNDQEKGEERDVHLCSLACLAPGRLAADRGGRTLGCFRLGALRCTRGPLGGLSFGILPLPNLLLGIG